MNIESAPKKRVLFVCTHNSARSQMAEGLVNKLYQDRNQAFSAGTEPGEVNVYAVAVMLEMGIDISHHRSKSITEFLDQNFDTVITVCDNARESCPFFPGGKKHLHKGFEDPAAFQGSQVETLAAFRRIRDQIRDWLKIEFA